MSIFEKEVFWGENGWWIAGFCVILQKILSLYSIYGKFKAAKQHWG